METAVPVRAFLLFNRFAIRASFVHISPVRPKKNKIQLSRMKNMEREAKGMKNEKKKEEKNVQKWPDDATDSPSSVMTIH